MNNIEKQDYASIEAIAEYLRKPIEEVRELGIDGIIEITPTGFIGVESVLKWLSFGTVFNRAVLAQRAKDKQLLKETEAAQLRLPEIEERLKELDSLIVLNSSIQQLDRHPDVFLYRQSLPKEGKIDSREMTQFRYHQFG